MENKLVEKLAKWMGWEDFNGVWCVLDEDNEWNAVVTVNSWNPTENIADAWEIVEKIKEDWLLLIQNQPNGSYWVGMHKKDTDIVNIHSKAKTAPMAICKAVKITIEWEEEE